MNGDDTVSSARDFVAGYGAGIASERERILNILYSVRTAVVDAIDTLEAK